jgi:hypothetical protein
MTKSKGGAKGAEDAGDAKIATEAGTLKKQLMAMPLDKRLKALGKAHEDLMSVKMDSLAQMAKFQMQDPKDDEAMIKKAIATKGKSLKAGEKKAEKRASGKGK